MGGVLPDGLAVMHYTAEPSGSWLAVMLFNSVLQCLAQAPPISHPLQSAAH